MCNIYISIDSPFQKIDACIPYVPLSCGKSSAFIVDCACKFTKNLGFSVLKLMWVLSCSSKHAELLA